MPVDNRLRLRLCVLSIPGRSVLILGRPCLTSLIIVRSFPRRLARAFVFETPHGNGEMQVVWQLSTLGLLVADYQKRLGLTREQALAKARATLGNGVQ